MCPVDTPGTSHDNDNDNHDNHDSWLMTHDHDHDHAWICSQRQAADLGKHVGGMLLELDPLEAELFLGDEIWLDDEKWEMIDSLHEFDMVLILHE